MTAPSTIQELRQFERMLAIAHERLVMLDELRTWNISIVFMKGVVVGVMGTVVTGMAIWGLWRWLR